MAEDNGSNILWFVAGLGIGAAVGILYAPKTGDETRERIRQAAEQGSGVVRERARQAREQAGTWVDKGREYLNQQRDQVRSAYHAGRQAYHEATAEGSTTEPTNP